tara:strand:- start:5807 stop:6916 length:1110 start_codon:yes stop_codon:yes gene_type:complete
MPQQITPETRERYIRALDLRDNGHTFREIAQVCGYADPATARYAWIGGLRLANRTTEIPTRTPRRVGVQIGIGNGSSLATLTVEQLDSFVQLNTFTFGIEIECIGLNQTSAARALHAAGIACEDNGYNHSTRPTWKVVYDGSLSSRTGSCEVVSPILSGTDGLTEVRTVMAVLRTAGARINESCGMHIHIGVDTLSQAHQTRIIRAYGKWSWAFTGFVLPRRVNNRWAQLRTPAGTERLASDWETSSNMRNTASRHDRYYAFNVHAFQRHGTFEMRAHHGSLNGMNASAWVALHTAFFEACKTETSYATLVGNAETMDEYNGSNDRPQAIEGAKRIAKVLGEMQLLDTDACEYLVRRAGNIPSVRSNNS